MKTCEGSSATMLRQCDVFSENQLLKIMVHAWVPCFVFGENIGKLSWEVKNLSWKDRTGEVAVISCINLRLQYQSSQTGIIWMNYNKPQGISKKFDTWDPAPKMRGHFRYTIWAKVLEPRSSEVILDLFDATQLGRYWKYKIWWALSDYPSRRFLFDHVLGLGTGKHCPFQFVALPCVCFYCIDGWWNRLLSGSGVPGWRHQRMVYLFFWIMICM